MTPLLDDGWWIGDDVRVNLHHGKPESFGAHCSASFNLEIGGNFGSMGINAARPYEAEIDDLLKGS